MSGGVRISVSSDATRERCLVGGGVRNSVSFGATIVTGSRRVIACQNFQVRATFITGSNERNLTYVPIMLCIECPENDAEFLPESLCIYWRHLMYQFQ